MTGPSVRTPPTCQFETDCRLPFTFRYYKQLVTMRFDKEDSVWVIDPGFWAMCSITSCSKWRFLAEVRDPDEVPEDFTCSSSINKDTQYNSCRAREQE